MNKVFLISVTIEILPRLKKSLSRSGKAIERNSVITVREENLNLSALNKSFYLGMAARAAGIKFFEGLKITSFTILREAKGI